MPYGNQTPGLSHAENIEMQGMPTLLAKCIGPLSCSTKTAARIFINQARTDQYLMTWCRRQKK
jgi:hypothetical protein